jgi:hypothetical protein
MPNAIKGSVSKRGKFFAFRAPTAGIRVALPVSVSSKGGSEGIGVGGSERIPLPPKAWIIRRVAGTQV